MTSPYLLILLTAVFVGPISYAFGTSHGREKVWQEVWFLQGEVSAACSEEINGYLDSLNAMGEALSEIGNNMSNTR